MRRIRKSVLQEKLQDGQMKFLFRKKRISHTSHRRFGPMHSAPRVSVSFSVCASQGPVAGPAWLPFGKVGPSSCPAQQPQPKVRYPEDIGRFPEPNPRDSFSNARFPRFPLYQGVKQNHCGTRGKVNRLQQIPQDIFFDSWVGNS